MWKDPYDKSNRGKPVKMFAKEVCAFFNKYSDYTLTFSIRMY